MPNASAAVAMSSSRIVNAGTSIIAVRLKTNTSTKKPSSTGIDHKITNSSVSSRVTNTGPN